MIYEPSAVIKSNKKNIIFISLILFANINVWAQSLIIVTQQETCLYNQSWFYSGSGSIQEEEIKKNWNEEKYIHAVGYTSKGWFISMAKGIKWTNQSYHFSSSWPDDWVHEKFRDGFMITSLAASDSKWLVIMSKNTDYTSQEICSAPWSSLSDWIKKWWNNDYYITSIACKNGMWTVVMSKTAIYIDQSYLSSSTVSGIQEKIKKKWEEGFRITALEYSGSDYLCIMSKFPQGKTPMQSYHINPSNVKGYIQKKWNESYNVIYIGG